MENEKVYPEFWKGLGIGAVATTCICILVVLISTTAPSQFKAGLDSNHISSLSDSDKNFIINVALNAPQYSDWCLMNGGTWMPSEQKQTYLPITKTEAGQLMQSGKKPMQDSNGNYYASVMTFDRICGVVQ